MQPTMKKSYYGRNIGDNVHVGTQGLRFAHTGGVIDIGHKFTIAGIQRNVGTSKWRFVYLLGDSNNRMAYLFPNEVY